MDRNYDETGLYDLHYALRTDHDTLNQPVYDLSQPVYDAVSYPQQSWTNPAPPDMPQKAWDLDEELAQMLSTATSQDSTHIPLDRPHRRSSRRRLRADSHFLDGGQRVTHVTILIAAILVCAACMLGWSIAYSYGQLHGIASSVLPPKLARWWPLMVYGPWFVAALSIVRATVQRRDTRRSWCVMLAASAMAVALSISHSSRSHLAFVMVGLPPVTALVCFWELVGQVSSGCRPRHAAHAQRRSKP
ncbi:MULTISPECIES: DUF2637 domain-containing protein [Streptomyces]|uniref:DUF2637 domain-containing protein n=1 Tax=Streptomyces TaxID=1883 RepID=UPI00292DAF2C|nr:DUF2637 domain-containing protein [Streptomyces sp. NEAU-HV9]